MAATHALETRVANLEAQAVNVRNKGAAGDFINDDTDAIRRALAQYVSARPSEFPVASIYLPAGRYRVTAPIVLDGLSFRIVGEGAATIIEGNFDEFIFKKTDVAVPTNSYIGHLIIKNTGALGGAISLQGTHGLLIEDAFLQAHGCFWGGANMFSGSMVNVTFRRGGTYAGSYGCMTGGVDLYNPDAQGFEIAHQLSQSHTNVFGGRTEVCGTAFVLGVNPWGAAHGWNQSVIATHVFEANDVGIDIRSCNDATIFGCTPYGTTNAPSGSSQYGWKMANVRNLTVMSSSAVGGHTGAAIQVGSNCQRVVFMAVAPANSLGVVWDIPDPSGVTHIATNYV